MVIYIEYSMLSVDEDLFFFFEDIFYDDLDIFNFIVVDEVIVYLVVVGFVGMVVVVVVVIGKKWKWFYVFEFNLFIWKR